MAPAPLPRQGVAALPHGAGRLRSPLRWRRSCGSGAVAGCAVAVSRCAHDDFACVSAWADACVSPVHVLLELTRFCALPQLLAALEATGLPVPPVPPVGGFRGRASHLPHIPPLRLRGGADDGQTVAAGREGRAGEGRSLLPEGRGGGWERACPQGTACTDFLCPHPHVFGGDLDLGAGSGGRGRSETPCARSTTPPPFTPQFLGGAGVHGGSAAEAAGARQVEELSSQDIARLVQQYGGSPLVARSIIDADVNGAQLPKFPELKELIVSTLARHRHETADAGVAGAGLCLTSRGGEGSETDDTASQSGSASRARIVQSGETREGMLAAAAETSMPLQRTPSAVPQRTYSRDLEGDSVQYSSEPCATSGDLGGGRARSGVKRERQVRVGSRGRGVLWGLLRGLVLAGGRFALAAGGGGAVPPASVLASWGCLGLGLAFLWEGVEWLFKLAATQKVRLIYTSPFHHPVDHEVRICGGFTNWIPSTGAAIRADTQCERGKGGLAANVGQRGAGDEDVYYMDVWLAPGSYTFYFLVDGEVPCSLLCVCWDPPALIRDVCVHTAT